MTDETSNERKSVWLLVSANGSTTPSTYHSAADAKRWVFGAQTPVEFVPKATLDAVVSAAVAESRARTFRAAITYVTGDLRAPHPDADAEAKSFAAAVRERIAAAVAEERARIRARVEALARMEAVGRYDMQTCGDENDEHGYWHAEDVLSAIDATEGGAP